MRTLAIKGHATRGKEVIEILKMLGGKDDNYYCGKFIGKIYFINNDGYIESCYRKQHLEYFQLSLEEFLEKFPYKVGDKVSVYGYETKVHIEEMKWDGFEIQYLVFTDETEWYSAEELNKYNEHYKEEIVEEKSVNHVYNVDDVDVISFDIAQKDIYELDLKDKFHVILRKCKYYVERIKPKYPKTFIEVLYFWHPDRQIEDDYQRCYKKDLIEKFQDLLYARDAYWKIAGEENKGNIDYVICYAGGKIIRTNIPNSAYNHILNFPTEEMRDAFYENFKDLIESCKELL